MQRRRFVLAATTALAAPAVVRAQETLKSAKAAEHRLVTLSRDLVQPWGMAFLPDGRMLITERPGRLRLFANGRLEPRALPGVPLVRAGGQAGLLDVCLHPNFAQNARFTSPTLGRQPRPVDHGGPRRTGRRRPRKRQVDLRGPPAPPRQSQSRLAHRLRPRRADVCQHRRSLPDAACAGSRRFAGKIVRLQRRRLGAAGQPVRRQGGCPAGNFTWGNRNPQGLARHPETGRIWEVEHGPKGGDELNILKAGANYGWPLVTSGVNYDGSKITDNRSLPGMEDALRTWVPSISPCGLTFYTADKFPGWKGSLFTGALSNYALFRIEVDGERYRSEERLLLDRLPYIRDVRQGPDGLLYLVTQSDDGGLFRLEPA